jgi:hypothetical protein
MSVNNDLTITTALLPTISNTKIKVLKSKESVTTDSLQVSNAPRTRIQDLESIKKTLKIFLYTQQTSKDGLEKQINDTDKKITVLKPNNIVVIIIYYIFSFLLKTKINTISQLESEKKTLLQKKVEVIEDIKKNNETLELVEYHITNVSPRPKEKIRYKSVKRHNRRNIPLPESPRSREIRQSADAFIQSYKMETLKKGLEPILSKSLLQTTQNLVNKIFSQDPEHAKYRVKARKQDEDISIEDNYDGTLTARLKTKHSVIGPNDEEQFRYDSTYQVHLDSQGHIQEASLENAVEKFSLNPNTPPLQIVNKNYPIPSADDEERYQSKFLDLYGRTTELRVSKNFIKDCDRQIDDLHIEGIGTLAPHHADLRREKETIDALEAASAKHPGSTIASQWRKNQSIKLTGKYRKQILDDFLTTIYKKLGTKHSSLPQVTYLFDPAAAAPLEELVAYKYRAFPYPKDSGQGVNYTITLDIPKEMEKPIRVFIIGQGKIDRFNVRANGTYTLHRDGHVEFEGEVS